MIFVRRQALLFYLVMWLPALAQAADEYIPRPGEFPPAGAGHYLVGELVSVDHVNRRGALRLMGDNTSDRYHRAPSHCFAMLPYGTVRYHGAPAELRDIPIGTVLHGYFVLPPAGDETIAPAEKSLQKYVPPFTHAISLEDDFSFYQRRGQSWKLLDIHLNYDSASPRYPPQNKAGDWRRTPIPSGSLTAQLVGEGNPDGLSGERTFTIDRSTRLWRGRQQIDWEDLAPADAWKDDLGREWQPANLIAQLNLTWAPDWQNQQFHVCDIWLDDESRELAAETQRQIHIRHMRHRWLPGWVDKVEHEPKGRGMVTVTLFGGMDASFYDAVRAQAKQGGSATIAAGEWTLRTWWQEHDSKGGRILDFGDSADPPQGSSGLQLRIQMGELLEGYRPGRIMRLRLSDFPNVKLPPEERVKGMTERVPPPYRP